MARDGASPTQAIHPRRPQEEPLSYFSKETPRSLAVVSIGPAAERRGVECRYCGRKRFRVVYTRPTWGARTMRGRESRHCGKRTTTFSRELGTGPGIG